eukprot:277240-Chlamydomonas_euryale.AAC.5
MRSCADRGAVGVRAQLRCGSDRARAGVRARSRMRCPRMDGETEGRRNQDGREGRGQGSTPPDLAARPTPTTFQPPRRRPIAPRVQAAAK